VYYTAKGLELLGMAMIGIGFIIKFPALMDPKMLLAGVICFGAGWVIEKYILKEISSLVCEHNYLNFRTYFLAIRASKIQLL